MVMDSGTWCNFSGFLAICDECYSKFNGNFSSVEDKLFWKHSDYGKFTVKSAYLDAIGYFDPRPNQVNFDKTKCQRLIWNLQIIPKLKFSFESSKRFHTCGSKFTRTPFTSDWFM